MAVSFDLFGTLVTAERPDQPWTATAAALRRRGVSVPGDWEAAYRESHADHDPGVEVSLIAHVRAALASRGVTVDRAPVREALLAAFDGPVTVRDGAPEALRAAGRNGPVGICSNCSLPGLVGRTLARAGLPELDVVVTSVGCGYRKPHDRAFAAVAGGLGVDLAGLVHVGDDPRTDGGARTTDATPVLTDEVPLRELPAWLEERP